MAQITNNRYTVDGVTYNARTGQPEMDNPLVPTQAQLDARNNDAMSQNPTRIANQGQPGFDVFGNPVARYTDTSVVGSSAGGVIGATAKTFAPGGVYDASAKPYTPAEEGTIRAQERTRVQAQIDAINEASNLELSNARIAGQGRLGSGRAIGAATGTLGSGTETSVVGGITAQNQAQEVAIARDKEARINAVLTRVEDRSQDLITKQKTLARENADAYIKYIGGVAEEARSQFDILAKAGAELSPAQRQTLIDQTGYDPDNFDQMYKSMRIANSADVINKNNPEIVGNKAIYFVQTKDARTGAITVSQQSLDLPGNGKTVKGTVARDDGIYVFYTDGTYQKVGEANAEKPVSVGEGVAPGSNSPVDKALSDSFNSAVLGLSAQQQKTATKTFKQYIQSGDTEGAKVYVIRVAMAGAPVDQQNQAIGRTTAIAAMHDLQDALAQAKKLGTNPNLISGNLVNIGTKLGASPDTNLSYIGSRITQALITYRRAMTGVAFGEAEAKDYTKIFPDITNIESLNSTKIQSLLDAFDANNRAVLGFYVGDSNYNTLYGKKSTVNLPNQGDRSGSFSTQAPDGKTYNFPDQTSLDSFKKAAGIK